MLTRHRPRIVEGRIHFDFERLPVGIDGTAGTVAGTAHIAYDGRGAWWPEQIEVSNPRHPGPQVFLAVIDSLFDEVAARLDRHRGEDIEERIAEALSRVVPVALDAAHRQAEVRPRPLNSLDVQLLPNRIRSYDAPARAAAQFAAMVAELACLGAFVAGVLCWSLPETAHAGAHALHAVAVVARLEETGSLP